MAGGSGGATTGRALPGSVELLANRLYWIPLRGRPKDTTDSHFFCIDETFVYWNFFLDFGPLSLNQTFRFCQIMSAKLADPKLTGKRIYLYCGQHSHRRTNSAFLICAYAMLYLDRTPEEAYAPFKGIHPPFPPFHDASPCVCTYHLSILDCLRGMYKAHNCGFFNFDKYAIEELERYEKVEYGDLNWVADGRFLAFAGPHEHRTATYDGLYTLTPDDYIPYFRKRGVDRVVRLNKKYYDERRFVRAGMAHTDLYYLDGSNPPERVLRTFMDAAESTKGALAVHCKAGLGRTGTCIGAYLMKHHAFTAAEVIGWLRVCRPGSVIGPQQQFLESIQDRMHREGAAYRAARGYAPGGVTGVRFPTVAVPDACVGPVAGVSSSTASPSPSRALKTPGRDVEEETKSGTAGSDGRRSGTPPTPVVPPTDELTPGHMSLKSKTKSSSGAKPLVKASSPYGSYGYGAFAGGAASGGGRAVTGPSSPGGMSAASDASQGDFLRTAKARSPGVRSGLGSSVARSAGRAATSGRSPAARTLLGGTRTSTSSGVPGVRSSKSPSSSSSPLRAYGRP